MLSAQVRQAAAASWPLPFRIYVFGMKSVTLKEARPGCAPHLGRMDIVDFDQVVIRKEHSQRRPAPTAGTSMNMYKFPLQAGTVDGPGRTITRHFKQHLWCTSNARFEHFIEDVSFTVGFYRLAISYSGSNGIDSLHSHLRLKFFDRINMDTDRLGTAISRLALFYGTYNRLSTAILDSLCSVEYTRILLGLHTDILDSLWSEIYKDTGTAILDSLCPVRYTRILTGAVQLF